MSGEGGIRTHGGVTPTPVFETGLFNRSSTSPEEAAKQIFYVTKRELGTALVWADQRSRWFLLFCFGSNLEVKNETCA
jgi:hypothetical protein